MDNETSNVLLIAGGIIVGLILLFIVVLRPGGGSFTAIDRAVKNRPTDPPPPPKNRRERRALKFGEEGSKENLLYQKTKQSNGWKIFQQELSSLATWAHVSKPTVHSYTSAVLNAADRTLEKYRNQLAKTTESHAGWLPCCYLLVMIHVSTAIRVYSGGTGLQGITIELQRFLEKHFRVEGIDDSLKYYKGRIQYNDRCTAMTEAILKYFGDVIRPEDVFSSENPVFDHPNFGSLEVMDRLAFIEHFKSKALNGLYPSLVAEYPRPNYDNQSASDRMHHENNKRHRSRRMTNQNRRKKRHGF